MEGTGVSIWRRASVAITVAAVLLPYAVWVATGLWNGTARDFIHIGHEAIAKSQASAKISGEAAGYHYFGEYGGDGQFQYFIAVDPVNARYYLDSPAYRYTRILYATLAGVLGLQRPDLVPYTLVLVNLLMIGIGTLALAAWLRRKGAPAYLAAVFAFYPGIYISLQQDLTEIMAYALVAVAVYLFDFGGRRRLLGSAIAFALALLTREVTAFFAAVYALGVLFAGDGPLTARALRNWRWGLAWAAIVVGPLVIWKGFLWWWLGSLGLEPLISPIPFGGMIALWPWAPGQVEELRTIVVPGTICCVAAAWAIAKGVRALPVWALLINSLVLIIFLGKLSYVDISSSGRVTIAVALAAVLSAPYMLPLARAWFWASAALWLTPMVYWFFIPVGHDSASHLLHWFRGVIHSAA